MLLTTLGQRLGDPGGVPHLLMSPLRQGRKGAALGLDALVSFAGHDGQHGDLSLGEWLIAHDRIVAWDVVNH